MFKESAAYIDRNKWVNVGSITATLAGNDMAAGYRTDAIVEAMTSTKFCIHYVKRNTVALEFRFRADSVANVSDVIDLYAASGIDHYTRVSRLTMLTGNQIYSGSILFKDAITETLLNWITDTKAVTPAVDDDHIGRYVLNTHGYDRFLFVSPTRNSTTIYVDKRRI
jgi:hypothetical protein